MARVGSDHVRGCQIARKSTMVSQICLEELETRPSLNCRSDGRNFRTVSRCVFGAEKSLVWVFQESDKFMVLQQKSSKSSPFMPPFIHAAIHADSTRT